jgi:hypothetical protein
MSMSAWNLLAILLVAAIVLSLLYLVLIRTLKSGIVWASFGFILALFAFGTVICIYYKAIPGAIIFAISFILFGIVMWFCRNKVGQ